ncbi:MAG: response regulator [Candidatus Aenigmatarchaeota archaeon]
MGKKILIIDDNEADLFILRRCLIHSGYNDIITVEDPDIGFEKIKEEKPDLVILDTLLPKSNGFEICSKIRELYGKDNPKIIIMTGSVDAVDAIKAAKVGANDYCAKTSDCLQIIEAVKKLI